jgi:hypothetical protein
MLTDRDRQILDFEEKWIDRPTGREMACINELGLRRARYSQLLTGLLDRQDALAEYPQLVYRLRERQLRRENARNRRLLRRDAS